MDRQHHPDDARRRDARRLHRRALGHRTDLEPDDLRQGDRRRRCLRRADRQAPATRVGGRGALLRARADGSEQGRKAVRAHQPPHGRRRRLGLARGLAAPRRRRQRDDRTGARAAFARGVQRLHQDPRHRGRPHGDRGVDLRRRPDQRHAAVLDRALPGRGRRVHARGGAPDRGGARPRRAFGRVPVPEPLGRRGRRSMPAGLRNRLGHRRGQAGLQRLPRRCSTRGAGSASPTRGRGRSACSGRARVRRTRKPRTFSTSMPWWRR